MTVCAKLLHGILDVSVFGGLPEKRGEIVSHMTTCESCRATASGMRSMVEEVEELLGFRNPGIPRGVMDLVSDATCGHWDGFVMMGSKDRLLKCAAFVDSAMKRQEIIPFPDIPEDLRELVRHALSVRAAWLSLQEVLDYIQNALRTETVPGTIMPSQ